MTGRLAELGLHSASRGDLIQDEEKRLQARKKKPNEHGDPLWQEARDQVKREWIDGPYPCIASRELFWNDEVIKVNTAFRFGVERGAQLRAVGDIESSETNAAGAIRTPINLPLWGHIMQICKLFRG